MSFYRVEAIETTTRRVVLFVQAKNEREALSKARRGAVLGSEERRPGKTSSDLGTPRRLRPSQVPAALRTLPLPFGDP